jgi:hypothetical protein
MCAKKTSNADGSKGHSGPFASLCKAHFLRIEDLGASCSIVIVLLVL